MNVHSESGFMSNLATLPNTVDDRTQEILGSIRGAFAEKGFDGASMQDLARAAGMSVGNFYRYFPSKAAIVQGMVALDLREIERDFTAILTSDDPIAVLRATILHRITEDCREDGRLWAEITAAALRKPEIGAAAFGMEAAIVDNLVTVFARVTGRTLDDARRRYTGHSQLLILLVKASAMRSSEMGPAGPDLAALILKTIDQTLTDVSIDISKG
jgi:AcrR family transcriptional regulator